MLQDLPEHLAVLTLRAVLAATPPCIRGYHSCTRGAASATTHHPKNTLHALLAILPEAFHASALRAFDSAIDYPHSLTLPPCDSPAAAAILRSAARSFAHLKALHIPAVTLSAYRRTDHADPMVAQDAAGLTIFAPVATMTALERVTINATGCAVAMHAEKLSDALGAALGCMPHLTLLRLSLKLSGGGSAAKVLAARLGALRVLCSLDISACGLCGGLGDGGVDALAMLAGALRGLRAVTHLSLAHNPLGTSGWSVLAPAAAAMPLHSLDLQACKLYDPFAIDGGRGTAAFSALRRLQLSGNRLRNPALQLGTRLPRLSHLRMHALPLSAEAEERLLQALLANDAMSLQVLDLGDCHAGAAATAALCRGLERWRGLHTVSLAWHPDATAPLPQLLPRLAALPCLQVLELRRVCSAAVSDIPPALAQCTGLSQLRVLEIGCSGVAAHAFSGTLATLTGLQSLEMCSAGREVLPHSAAVALVRQLCTLTPLTRLKLRGLLGTSGAAEVMRGAACMTSMRDLALAENDIGPHGVAGMTPVLAAMGALSKLDLGGNRLRHEGGVALAAMLPRMRALRVLSLRGCELSPAAKQAVVRAAPHGMHGIDLSH